jgi:hypothetical protein
MKLAKQSICHKEIRNTKRDKRDEDSFAVLDGGGGVGGVEPNPTMDKKSWFFIVQVRGPTDFLKLEFFNILFIFLRTLKRSCYTTCQYYPVLRTC